MAITYQELINSFDANEWHIGYIQKSEYNLLLNTPTKYYSSYFENKYSINDDLLLILVFNKKTINYDYSQHKQVEKVLTNLNINYINLNHVNLKYAAILAGLGQYGKNQLVHDDKFDFDIHISCYGIQTMLENIPEHPKIRFNYLSSCQDCFDCINSCPVQAIQVVQGDHYFINTKACDEFCLYGNNDRIVSMKNSWINGILKLDWTQEEQQKILTEADAFKYIGSTPPSTLSIANTEYYIQYPVCRECCSQPKCSKYNGSYPYNKQNYNLIRIGD